MKETHFSLFMLFFLTTTLLSMTGCNSKKEHKEVYTQKEDPSIHKTEPLPSIEKKHEQNASVVKEVKEPIAPKHPSFQFLDEHNQSYAITISPKQLQMTPMQKPLMLLHIYDATHRQGDMMIPYFENISKKYHEKLFIAVLPSNTLEKEKNAPSFISSMTLKEPYNIFMETLKSSLLLENNTTTLPLSILYYKGKYLRHYEGMTPIEMILHDLKNTIQNKKEY